MHSFLKIIIVHRRDYASEIPARKKELHISAIDDNSKERLEREIEEHEARIDELVCQLYQIERIPR